MADRPLPEKLYQYQPCNELTMANIINSVIHLGSPSRFNDPFECSFNITPPQTKEIPMLRKKLLEIEPNSPPRNDDEFLEYLTQQHEPTYAEIKEIINKLGVCCLSEHHPKSDISFRMWSHYADKHHGFCLEFDTSDKPFSTALDVEISELFDFQHEINRQELMPKINSLLQDADDQNLQTIFRIIKSILK